MITSFFRYASAIAVTLLTVSAANAACGRVSIASMNWQSAEVLASIDDIILCEGYGCDVEIVPGDTMPTLTSMMEKGQPDVAPEAWVDAVREPLEAAVKEGRLHYAAHSLKDGGIEGWWIPKYFADAHPDIKTIDDALSHPELLPYSDDKTKGAVYNCPSGWNCQNTTANAFKAWKAAEKGFVLVDTGSAAGLEGGRHGACRALSRRGGGLVASGVLGAGDLAHCGGDRDRHARALSVHFRHQPAAGSDAPCRRRALRSFPPRAVRPAPPTGAGGKN